jgi:hypothetical protein
MFEIVHTGPSTEYPEKFTRLKQAIDEVMYDIKEPKQASDEPNAKVLGQ